jgi:ATP-binding cassette subfamily B protein
LTIDWRLALVVFMIVPVLVAFSLTFHDKFLQAFRRNKETLAIINEHIEESSSGVRVVRAFVNEQFETARFDEGNELFRSSRIASVWHIGFFDTGVYRRLYDAQVESLLVSQRRVRYSGEEKDCAPPKSMA